MAQSSTKRYRFALGEVASLTVLVVLVLLALFPLIFLAYGSLKSQVQWGREGLLPVWPPHPENFVSAWRVVSPFIRNSIIVSVASVAGVMVVSCLSGWVFARFDFPGKTALFLMIIGLLMVPGVLTLVTRFVIAFRLGLYDKLLGLISFYISGGQVFAILILRGFFSGLPEELFEAARIDSASEAQSFLRIAMPLSKPILLTIAVMNVLSTWNQFIWPFLVIKSEQNFTIVLSVFKYREAARTSNYAFLFAAYALCALPLVIFFAFTSRYYIAGLMSGAIKA